mmetsp:Transcript_10279/g.25781  ORF Transcript_10279/g.25781 Transcript_10279/m.25781 type:complete len:174 (-) Transcript_10279:72-593(-)
MNFTYYGPGSQWGKPFYHQGQECEKINLPRASPSRGPLDLSTSAHMQTRANDRLQESSLRIFADPPTHRSCHAAHNKDGGMMDSHSHYVKVGSKHMCDPRPDRSSSMTRSMSVPGVHPWDARRVQMRDPTPWHFNAAFTTTSDGVGKFYHSHLMTQKLLHPRQKHDGWAHTKA